MIATDKLFSKFLCTSYLVSALVGGLVDRECEMKIFDILSKVYLIKDEEKLNKFRALSFNEDYYGMNTLAEYERTCRMLEYAQMRGIDTSLTDEDRLILSAKRIALRSAKEILPEVENLNPDTLTDALLKGISVGNVTAMTTLAFLNETGIAIGKNHRRAVVNLNHAARWNSISANLLLAYFDTSRVSECIARILASDKGSDTQELVQYVCECYGVDTPESDVSSGLLERAFCLGAVERHVCDVTFEGIIYSSAIPVPDKKRAIESYNKGTMNLYDAIPADAATDTAMVWDKGAFSDIAIVREDEIRRIKRNLIGIKGRAKPQYKPLMLVCRDAYVLHEYKRALGRALCKNPIRMLDARHFNDYTFSQTANNVFLSEISSTHTTSTVFMIDSCHALGPVAVSMLSKYLRGDTRAEFRLLQPSLGFDLSGILPVLFSQAEPDGALSDYCDVIRLNPITAEEKGVVISDILERYLDAYGIENVTLCDAVVDILKTKSTEQIEECVDEVVKYMALEDREGEVDEEAFKLIMKDIRVTTVKFGF